MTNNRRATVVKITITFFALLLLVVTLTGTAVKLNPTVIALLALALLPWLSSLVESAKLPGGWEIKFREVEHEQERQRQDVDSILTFLFENFVNEYELRHLEKLDAGSPFPFRRSGTFEAELRRLLALGLIARRPNRGIRSMFEAGDDVRNHLEITERGRLYLSNRRKLQTSG